MSDALQVTITATGAAELGKLFENLEKVSAAAGKLHGSGKALEELRKIIVGVGKSSSGFDQLRAAIKDLNATVQALPTQMAVALNGLTSIGRQAGKAMTDGMAEEVKRGGDKAAREAKAAMAKVRQEVLAATRQAEGEFSTLGVRPSTRPQQRIADQLRERLRVEQAELARYNATLRGMLERQAEVDSLAWNQYNASLSRGALNTAQVKRAAQASVSQKLKAEQEELARYNAALKSMLERQATLDAAAWNQYNASLSRGAFNTQQIKKAADEAVAAQKAALQSIQAQVKAATVAAAGGGLPYSSTSTGRAFNMPGGELPKPPSSQAIGALRQFTQHANEAHSAARGLASGLGLLWLTWGSMIPLLAGAALSNSVVQMVKLGAAVEENLTVIGTLGGASAREIEELNTRLLELGAKGPQGPLEIAKALKTMSLAGLNAKESMEALAPTLQFGLLTPELPLEQATESLAAIATAFGYTAKEWGSVGDVIVKTAAASMASTATMTEAFRQSSVVAQEYGVSLKDAATSLALLHQIGIRGSAAGTAMRQMYNELIGGSMKTRKVLAELGIETWDMVNNKMKPFRTVLEEVVKSLAGLNGKDRLQALQDFMNERGMKAVVAGMAALRAEMGQTGKSAEEMANSFAQMAKDIDEAPGTMAIAAARMAVTSENLMKGVKNSLESSLVQAFKEIQPSLVLVTQQLRAAFNSPEFINGLKLMGQTIGSISVFLAEHIGLLYDAAKAYVVWRAAVAAFFVTLRGAVMLEGVLTAFKGAAAGAGLLSTGMTALGAASAASVAPLGAAAVGVRGLLLALGPFAALAAAAATAWWLFSKATVDANAERVASMAATAKLTEDALDEEIKRLESLRNARADGLTGELANQRVKSELIKDEISGRYAIQQAALSEAEAVQEVRLAKLREAAETAKRHNPLGFAQQQSLSGIREAERELLKLQLRKGELRRDEMSELGRVEAKMTKLRDLAKEEFEAASKAAAARTATPQGTGSRKTDDPFNPSAMLTEKAAKEGLDLLDKTFQAQLQTQQRAFQDQQQILDASLRAKLITEGDYYVKSLTQTIAYEQERKALILRYQNEAADAIGSSRAELKSRFPNIEAQAQLGSAALGKLPRDLQKAISVWNSYGSQLAEIRVKTEQLTASLEMDIAKRRELSSITLRGHLAQEAEGFREVSQAVQLANEKEQERLNITKNGDTSNRAKVEAKARLEAVSAFAKQMADLEKVVVRQQEVVNQLGAAIQDAFLATGDYPVELADQWGLTNTQLEKSRTALAEIRKNVASLGDVAAENAGLTYWQKLEKSFDTLLEKSAKFGEAFEDGFGRAGKALVRVLSTWNSYHTKQKEITRSTREMLENTDDETQKEQIRARAKEAQAQNDIEMWVATASAAKGFFNENSRGYKALEAAENTYRAVTVAGNMAVALSNAVVGVTNQAKGDPYTAIPRMAAMAAIMAGLGVATGFFGSKSSTNTASSEARQAGAATGRMINAKDSAAGTILGDDSARSESIRKSLESLEDSNLEGLRYSLQMAASLRNIESSMAGVARIILQTQGITTGKNMGIFEGTLSTNKGDPIFNMLGSKALIDLNSAFLKLPVIGKILGELQSLWGKTTQKVVDSGLEITGTVGSLAAGQGVRQYADVATTTSSWFGLKKDTSVAPQFGSLDPAMATQFGLIFKSLGVTLQSAADALGQDSKAVGEAISNYVVEIPRLSLMGLKGDEVQKAVEAAVSSAADLAAEAVLPGFKDFQRVGEGYFETVVRVATGMEQAQAILEKFNLEAINYTDVVNKQGDATAELVRQTIAGRESVGGVLNGVGEIISLISGTGSDLAETYRALLDVREVMGQTGLRTEGLGLAMVRGAGGMDNLKTSLDSFFENYFSDAERTAAKTATLTKEFGNLGRSLPESRAELRSWIQSIDTSTEAGQAAQAQLLGLAQAFADLREETDRSKEIAEQRASLEARILELQGNTAELRRRELAALEPVNRSLQEYIYALEDAAALQQEREGLERQLLTLQENTVELRRREVEAISPLNRWLLVAVHALTDLKNSLADLKSAAESAMSAVETAVGEQKRKLQEAFATQAEAIDKAIKAANDRYTAVADSVRAQKEAAKDLHDDTLAPLNAALKALDASVKAQDKAYKEQTKALDAERKLAEAAYKEAAESLQATIEANQKIVNDLKGLNDALNQTIDSLRPIGSEAADRQRAQLQLKAALETAQATGKLPTAEEFKTTLTALSQPSENLFSTFQDYSRDFYRTVISLRSLEKISGDQLDDAQTALDVAIAQKESLDKAHTEHMEHLDSLKEALDLSNELFKEQADAQREVLQEQIDAAKTAYDSTLDSLDQLLAEAERARDATVKPLEAQKEQLEDQLKIDLKGLDDLLAAVREQYNAIMKVDASVLTIPGAIAALGTALQAYATATGQGPVTTGGTGTGTTAVTTPTGQWVTSGNTRTWLDEAGARAVGGVNGDSSNTVVVGVNGQTATLAQVQGYIGTNIGTNPQQVATAATSAGLSAASIDAAMGYTPGTYEMLTQGKTLKGFSRAAIRAFLEEQLAKGNIQGIYDAAKSWGVSSYTLDAVMGYSPGTALQAALSLGLPAFASGGLHEGGLALVGEQGPELINTGSSARVWSYEDTMQMLRSPGKESEAVVQELIALRQEVKQLREHQEAANGAIATNTGKTARTLKKWDDDGQPETRVL